MRCGGGGDTALTTWGAGAGIIDGLGPRWPGLGRDLPRPSLLIRLAIRARMPERTIFFSLGRSLLPPASANGRWEGPLWTTTTPHPTRNILPVKPSTSELPRKNNYFYISIANTVYDEKPCGSLLYHVQLSLYMAVAGATISDLSSPSGGGWSSKSPLARTWLVADGSEGA